jgi:hypothetical protein
MTRASRSGTALKTIGVTLIVVGVQLPTIMHLLGWGERMPLGTRLIFLFFVMFLTISLGSFLVWRGREYVAKADAEKILSDSYPHVLYLRAFRSDEVFNPLLRGGMPWAPWSLEERLADALRPLGYLVAIGQPGEGLPKPGAARIYASDDEWKEVVRGQMRVALLVIIRASVGGNLLWEAKEAVETLNPQKVLIFVFRMKAKQYESFRTKITQMLGVSLPEEATLQPLFGRVSGFISFDTDWKPIVFPLPRFIFPFAIVSSLKFALRPVFESFGLK